MYRAENYFALTRLMRVFVLFISLALLIAVLSYVVPRNTAATQTEEKKADAQTQVTSKALSLRLAA